MRKNDFGKGSKKRHDAAIKAARTKKENTKKQKSPNINKKNIRKGKIHPKIANYIENRLKDLIINDLKNNLISNEADLQFSVIFHLKEFLRGFDDVKVSAELPIRIKSTDSDTFADVVISKIVYSFSEISPLIAIELKEQSELNEDALKKDIKKLEKLRKHRAIKYGYQIFVCRSKHPEKELQDLANGFVEKAYSDRIIPIIINIYDHISGTEKITFDRRWIQTKRYYHDIATAHVAVKSRKRNERRNQRILKRNRTQ